MLRQQITQCVRGDAIPSRKMEGHLLTLIPHKGQSATKGFSKSTTSSLLSKENCRRCVKCMQETPNIGLKMRRNQSEKHFAAVLIALCVNPKSEEVSLLYTKRSGKLSRHMWQISFPGGIKDPTDADFVDCALRETEEEIGLSRSRIEIWGTGSMITPPNTSAITPVLGTIHNFDLNELKLNAAEVEEAFTLPILKLAAPQSMHYTQFKSGYSAPVFLIGRYKIWGITAFLTKNFLNCFLPNSIRNNVKYIKPFRNI